MLELNDTNGPGAFKKEQNYMLMFYTDWCPRCPPLAAILDKLQKSRASQFEFVKINYDQNPMAVDFFNVTGVPFVFALKENAVIAGWGGLTAREAYERIADIAFNPPGKKLSQIEVDALMAIGKEYRTPPE